MFNFLKKNTNSNKLDNIEAIFIKTIVNSLSTKYPLFKQELELETFIGIGKNPGGSDGSFAYFINNDSWKKICDTSIGNFFIKNIKFNSYRSERVIVDIFTSEGLIIGYKTSVDVKDINVETIGVSEVWEKHFLNEDYSAIEHIIGTLSKEKLRELNIVKITFKIIINGASYYPIRDNGDGNYLAIDKSGSVFNITHDPFKVQKIDDTINQWLEKR